MRLLISVIVPVYNVEKYLERCVESILNQTYSKLEIILVDDGSTDSSGSKCDILAKRDKRIKVIHKKNGGLSDARNYGLNIATGDYILFVDSDDWIEKNMVEYLINLILETEADISVCGYFEDYNNSEGVICSKDVDEKIYVYNSNVEALYALNYYGESIGTVSWNKLYKMSIFDQLRFDKGRLNEDVFLTPKLFYQAKRVTVSTKKLYHYIVSRPDSIMNQSLTEKNLDLISAFYSNFCFFMDKNEKKYAYIYWFKYYGAMIDMYCKFYMIHNNIISERLKNQIKKEFITLLKKSLVNKNWKELLRGVIFNIDTGLYITIWRLRK